MIRLTRALLRDIKRMPINELDTWLKAFYEEAYEEGYAEGLTADLDGDEFVVMDGDGAKQHLKELLEDM